MQRLIASSVASISSTVIWMSLRVSGFIVVSQSCSGFISPTCCSPLLPEALASFSLRPITDCLHRANSFPTCVSIARVLLNNEDSRDRFHALHDSHETSLYPEMKVDIGRPSLALLLLCRKTPPISGKVSKGSVFL